MRLVIYAAVAPGGALGAMPRYSVSLRAGAGFFGINGPLATLSVNVIGSCVMGLLAGLVAGGLILPEAWRAFFAAGLLGVLTTFSSLALDAGTLLHKQRLGMAMLYVRLSLCLSLGSFALCNWLARIPS
jgi:CrcB protein